MINIVISIVYFLGGFMLLFNSKKRHNIYLSVGFILYGLQFLLNIYILEDWIFQILFNIPRLLGSLCIMMSPVYFLMEGEK